IRRRVGMVFQRPNPFPTMSIYDNVAAGIKLNGVRRKRDELDGLVERSLQGAGLWNEVRNRLKKAAGDLSGGQQQRLCIARAIEAQDVELADEVIAFDDEIDARFVAIQEGIQALLARQTPVAVDLRLVLAMLHVNLHLERAGDYCVTIAKLVKLTEALAGDPT